MNCPNCGNQVPDGTKFCTFCGTKLAVAPVAAAMQQAVEEPFQNAAYEAPAFNPEPVQQEAPSFEPAFEPEPEAPSFEPEPEAPVNEAPAFEAAPFAAAPFVEEAAQPKPQAWQPQNQGFQPQNQAWQPQNQGFQPQNQGFQPQNQGFQPQNQAWQPQNQGFQPQNQAWQPQNQAWQPQNQNQGFQPQGGYQPQQPQQPQKGKKAKAPKTNEPKKKKKTGLVIGIILGALLLIGAAIFAIIKFGQPKDPDPVTINLNDYVTVEFEGYNGLGTVSKEEFNSKALMDDYEDSIQWTNAAKKNYKYVVEAYDSAADFALGYLLGSVEYTDNYFNLKNGDKVTWTWTSIDTDYISTLTNAVIEAEDFDIEVKGLEEVELFDPFEGLEVSFSGNSGSGYCEYTQTKTDGVYADLYYWCDNNFDLKNGDEVRIYIDEWSDLEIQEKGMMPSRTEVTYTVEGLPYYVTEFSDIPADVVADMADYLIQYLTNDIVNAKIDGITDVKVTYEGSYYAILKDGSYSIDTNRLYNIFNVTFKANGTPISYYYYTVYTDMYIDAEGVFSYYEKTVDNYDTPPDTFSYAYTKDGTDHNLTIRGYDSYSKLEDAIYSQCSDFDIVQTP